ncbi:PAS and ANTAR domain-containing protein [Phycicoccus sp. SLBN-51]|uniref:PAS and ANTAR domain-containing protein n=1 Tax=Phycicoccus sp. SLBN-51 TaxID=2768447 RepID=UPI00114E145F|nr:PAS and ANTAR domain-containing protein [Phycicoccus sp. SLBN-51]TQJ48737.1 PAS domain-containing protein [Phycicoccus sp. SLBN-51]
MTDVASIIPLHAVSTYEYDALQDCWSWASPIPVLQYATDGSPLTTEQLLAFVHPDDREPTLAQFLGLLQDRTPYSCLYRLVDSAGVAHPVVNVGTPVVEGDEVTALRGFVVDLTAPLGAHARSAVAAMLPVGAVVDQATGALMLAFGVDAEIAYRLLTGYASRAGAPVHGLAADIVDGLASVPVTGPEVAEALIDLLESSVARIPLAEDVTPA